MLKEAMKIERSQVIEAVISERNERGDKPTASNQGGGEEDDDHRSLFAAGPKRLAPLVSLTGWIYFEWFCTRFVTSLHSEGAQNRCKLLRTNGGGGATRTPDLGIMRPSL